MEKLRHKAASNAPSRAEQTRVRERAVTPQALAGQRFDRVAAALFPAFSRTRLQCWIRSGQLRADDVSRRPREPLAAGTVLSLDAECPVDADAPWHPAALDFRLLYEDDALLVVDKSPGMVVHPAPGHREDTLANALLHRCPELEAVPRAGIVHRLDRDTGGLLMVARTPDAYASLVRQLQERTVRREYRAVVNGVLSGGGRVDAPLGRDPGRRTRIAVREDGRPALTHYRVRKRFRAHSDLQLRLATGRTHQVRAHLAHLGYPLTGDVLYGGRLRLPPAAGPELQQVLRAFKRQALHAVRLGVRHPLSGETLQWESDLPADMQRLLRALAADLRAAEES